MLYSKQTNFCSKNDQLFTADEGQLPARPIQFNIQARIGQDKIDAYIICVSFSIMSLNYDKELALLENN